jgi:hypothetical protein
MWSDWHGIGSPLWSDDKSVTFHFNLALSAWHHIDCRMKTKMPSYGIDWYWYISIHYDVFCWWWRTSQLIGFELWSRMCDGKLMFVRIGIPLWAMHIGVWFCSGHPYLPGVDCRSVRHDETRVRCRREIFVAVTRAADATDIVRPCGDRQSRTRHRWSYGDWRSLFFSCCRDEISRLRRAPPGWWRWSESIFASLINRGLAVLTKTVVPFCETLAIFYFFGQIS